MTVGVASPAWQTWGRLPNSWRGEGSHLRTAEQPRFSMQRGPGKARDIRGESGPSLTPLYNSSPGIRGTSNPRFRPAQKEEGQPFHSDPVLKGGAAETLETVKFFTRIPGGHLQGVQAWQKAERRSHAGWKGGRRGIEPPFIHPSANRYKHIKNKNKTSAAEREQSE